MNSTKFARRSVLSTLGLTAGSSLFPSLNRRLEAAEPPKRFLVFFTYHGTLPQFWTPTGTETDFTLNSLMKPYEAFKKDLVLLDNIDVKSWPLNPDGANGHQSGHLQALCPYRPVSNELCGGRSIDQEIARGLIANGIKTKFPSLEFGVNNDETNFPSYDNISYTGPGQVLPSEGSPSKIWNNVFKGFAPAAASPPKAPVLDVEAVKRKSMIDYMKSEVDFMSKKLGSFDKMRSDNIIASVKDLENSLSLGTGAGTTVGAGAGCAALPSQSIVGGFKAIVAAQVKMLQMAFSCDLTRVASFNIDELTPSSSGNDAHVAGTNDPHDLAHKTSQGSELSKDPVAVEAMRRYHLVYGDCFNKVLTALNAPDIDGKRLLDNTIVLWAGQIAKGGHELEDYKWMLAGSGGGAIRTGRWLKCGGTSHPNLFVSLARAMGVQIDTFGEKQYNTVPLKLT